MEIAVVGATALVTLADGAIASAAVAITALAPTIRLVPEAAAALVGSDGGPDAVREAAQAAAARLPSRSRTSVRRPTTAAPWRKS